MVGVDGGEDYTDGSDYHDGTEDNSNDGDSSNDNSTNQEKVKGNITNATPFSEGYAFISQDDGDEPLCNICINEKGKILFTLDGETDEAYTSFKNGHAMAKINDQICLIDTSGNVVVSPETHGYTAAVEGDGAIAAFYDGYFVVHKATATIKGTVYEYGVINTDGTWKHDFSSLGDITGMAYSSSYRDNVICLLGEYAGETYWNLQNNRSEQNPLEWFFRSGYSGFYESEKEIIDTSETYPTLYTSTGFYRGEEYAGVVFHPWEEGVYFFSLMDRAGNLLFDPVQIAADSNQHIDEDKNLISYINSDFEAVIADLSGNVKATFVLPETETQALINEGNHGSDSRNVSIAIGEDGKSFLIHDQHVIRRSLKRTEYNYFYFIDLDGNLIFQ